MNRLFVLVPFFLLLAVSAASAAPIGFSGDYRFSGVVPVMRITSDVIDTRSAGWESRRQELWERGAACVYVMANTIKCTSHLKGDAVPPESLARVASGARDWRVSFGKVLAAPTLVSDAPALTEWRIHQEVIALDLPEVRSFRYMDMEGRLIKLVFGAGDGALWLHADPADPGTLRKMESVVTTESRWRWHEDVMEVELSRTASRSER